MDTRTKQLFSELKALHDGLAGGVDIDTSETPAAQRKRIERLEADPEAWFAYYFAAYVTAPPAAFHTAATQRVLQHAEWYEVRNWSRELAKSTRTMMEVLYLVLVGNTSSLSKVAIDRAPTDITPPLSCGEGTGERSLKKNVILVSNTKENADRLLLPYMTNLEKNARIINDYGAQKNLGRWTSGEFTTRKGVSFRAIGAGQSPRGTRNEAARPDIILIDDIDTDEDCRNPEILDKRWEWVEQALIPTRSISNPLLVIFCGNVIAEDCCVVRARRYADNVDVVNIRNAQGRSAWPEKNSEEDIDRVLSSISYGSAQKEYFNEPMSTGRTFAEMKWGPCPPLHTLPFVVVYADPAPGNKDAPGAATQGNSRKAVFAVGHSGTAYYIYKGFLDVMGSARFINCLYACSSYIQAACTGQRLPAIYTMIENNSLQDPFYDQVYRPLIQARGIALGETLSVLPDTRRKPDKWLRIEATLQSLNATGNLVLNIDEKDDEHMKRLEAQFKAARAGAKQLDGPDCIEGAVYIVNEKLRALSPNAVRATLRSDARTKDY